MIQISNPITDPAPDWRRYRPESANEYRLYPVPADQVRRDDRGGVMGAVALAMLLIVLLTGCRATTTHSYLSPKAAQLAARSTVAVVPFENLSHHRHAGLAVTDLTTSVLMAQDYFEVLEAGSLQEDGETRFRRLENTPWERQLGANPVAAAAVGEALGVDCVLTGSIGEYGFVDGFGETATVGITLRLVESGSGGVLWAGSLSRRVGSVAFSEESAHRLAHQVIDDLVSRMVSDLRAM